MTPQVTRRNVRCQLAATAQAARCCRSPRRDVPTLGAGPVRIAASADTVARHTGPGACAADHERPGASRAAISAGPVPGAESRCGDQPGQGLRLLAGLDIQMHLLRAGRFGPARRNPVGGALEGQLAQPRSETDDYPAVDIFVDPHPQHVAVGLGKSARVRAVDHCLLKATDHTGVISVSWSRPLLLRQKSVSCVLAGYRSADRYRPRPPPLLPSRRPPRRHSSTPGLPEPGRTARRLDTSGAGRTSSRVPSRRHYWD